MAVFRRTEATPPPMDVDFFPPDQSTLLGNAEALMLAQDANEAALSAIAAAVNARKAADHAEQIALAAQLAANNLMEQAVNYGEQTATRRSARKLRLQQDGDDVSLENRQPKMAKTSAEQVHQLAVEAKNAAGQGDKVFYCTICHKLPFERSRDFLAHSRKEHTASQPYSCWEMGCNKMYSDPNSLVKHVREKHFNRPQNHVCGHCAEKGELVAMQRSDAMKQHVANIHLEGDRGRKPRTADCRVEMRDEIKYYYLKV